MTTPPKQPTTDPISQVAKALKSVFISPNVADSNLEPANIVDVLDRLARAIFALADAIETHKQEQEDDDA